MFHILHEQFYVLLLHSQQRRAYKMRFFSPLRCGQGECQTFSLEFPQFHTLIFMKAHEKERWSQLVLARLRTAWCSNWAWRLILPRNPEGLGKGRMNLSNRRCSRRNLYSDHTRWMRGRSGDMCELSGRRTYPSTRKQLFQKETKALPLCKHKACL